MDFPLTKTEALNAIKKYEDTLSKISTLLDGSGETLYFWSEKLGLSHTAISNKRHGRRDWKPKEIRIILEVLKKEVKIVDEYTHVLDNIDNMIAERGFKKLFFYHKAGLSNMQVVTRSKGKKQGVYEVWNTEEIRKLVEAL